MTDLRKAAEKILEMWDTPHTIKELFEAKVALRQALAQPEERGHCTCGDPTFLGYVHFRTRPCIYYTSLPKREWVGLTDEEKSFLKETWLGFKDIDKVIDTVDELLRRRIHDRPTKSSRELDKNC